MPTCVVAFAMPSGSVLEALAGVGVAVVLSLAATRVGAALWMRHPLARDVLFADLMAWEWARRLWVERRLARAQSALGARDLAPQARAEALRDLARHLEARDAYTHGHSRRVARHALRIAKSLHVPAAEAERIWTAATLHDVGKLYTPREILNKPGRLTDDEFEVIKRHPVDGAAMLTDISGEPEIVAIVRSHHERLDGRGYPDGLAGAAIPLGARIIAVADTFDALTSTRSYRPAATHKRALDILRNEAGTQLDGAAVAAFLRSYSGRRPAAVAALLALGPQRLLAWAGQQASAVAGLAPAAGWIAPVAAAAAAVVGVSQGVDRTAADPPGRAATPTAAVRAAPPARTASLDLGSRVSTRPTAGRRPTTNARRPSGKHGATAPAAPGSPVAVLQPPAAGDEGGTGATAAAQAPPASAAPPSSGPAAPSAREIVTTVTGRPVPGLPVAQPAASSVTDTVTEVAHGVASTVDDTLDDASSAVGSLLQP